MSELSEGESPVQHGTLIVIYKGKVIIKDGTVHKNESAIRVAEAGEGAKELLEHHNKYHKADLVLMNPLPTINREIPDHTLYIHYAKIKTAAESPDAAATEQLPIVVVMPSLIDFVDAGLENGANRAVVLYPPPTDDETDDDPNRTAVELIGNESKDESKHKSEDKPEDKSEEESENDYVTLTKEESEEESEDDFVHLTKNK